MITREDLQTTVRDLGLLDETMVKNNFPEHVRLDTTKLPQKDVAAAIALYIFIACEALDDFCISRNVFGGWNRVTCGEDKWGAWESHCTKKFIELCKERCPWVEIW